MVLFLQRLGCLVLIVWLAGCDKPSHADPPTSPQPPEEAECCRVGVEIVSPDGQVSATPYVNDDYLVAVEIVDGASRFDVVTPASDAMTWYLSWVSDETLLLDSSDVGYVRIEEVDGAWMVTDY